MIQLLLHLFGDYVTQSHWMATQKTSRALPCLIHATLYTLPFELFLTHSLLALAVIMWTHFFIDRFRLARFVCFAHNFLAPIEFWPTWKRSCKTGFDPSVPDWLAVWLLIITDNFLHLSINYLALRYL